jgi:hypothetical protein
MQPESNSPTKKIATIVIVILVILVVIYYFFFRGTAPAVTLDQFGNPVSAQVVGQDLVELLNKLQSVTLDDSIFHDPAFINLTDFSTTLPNLPVGRANPFDNLAGQGVVAPVTPAKGK